MSDEAMAWTGGRYVLGDVYCILDRLKLIMPISASPLFGPWKQFL